MRDRILVVVTAVGMSSALVLGHATSTTVMDAMVALSNTVIGAGGRGDTLGERVQQKLSATLQPDGYDYDPVHYPATYNLAGSRNRGAPAMRLVLADHSTELAVIIAGYSEGSLVAERVRRDLQDNPAGAPNEEHLSFVMIGSPFAANGGVYDRFPGLFIPLIIDAMTPSQPTRYDTTYHALEYDPFADFPAYFNPLALLNSALAFRYAHPDKYYDAIDPENTPHVQRELYNTAGGKDTYILYLNPHLPLLGPIRELASILRLTPITEPLLGAVEPLLRLVVDMAYTDRTYENAEVHTRFSLITPPDKIIEALRGVPGALREGLTNLLSGGQTALAAPSLAADTNSITVSADSSETPSTLPALHDRDFRSSRPAKAPDAERGSESVVVQEDTQPEVTTPTEQQGTGSPVTTAPPAETAETAEADSDTKPDTKPDIKPTRRPGAKPNFKPSFKPPSLRPSTKPDPKPSAPDSENDNADAAA